MGLTRAQRNSLIERAGVDEEWQVARARLLEAVVAFNYAVRGEMLR